MKKRIGWVLMTELITDTTVDDKVHAPPWIQLDTVLLKVASRCNIDCRYCYVYQMGDDRWSRLNKLMSPDTMDAVAESLGEVAQFQQRGFAVVLHGGEPLLLGYKFLSYLLEKLRKKLPAHFSVSIQTNGILISEEILDLCYDYRTTLAVSIDGPRHVHDHDRIDKRNKGTFDQVIAGIRKLEQHRNASFLYTGLLAVINPETDPIEIYNFFKALNPPSVDFLYRDGNHSLLPFGKSSIASIEYGKWMTNLLNVYLNDTTPIKIRILDDMIKALLGEQSSKEGLGVTDYGIVIIDTDGSIARNDTLKSAYYDADRFKYDWHIQSDSLLDVLQSRDFSEYHNLQKPTSTKCLQCPELNYCGGGMTTHRWHNNNGFDNPSVYCSDQLYLVGNIRRQLKELNVLQ